METCKQLLILLAGSLLGMGACGTDDIDSSGESNNTNENEIKDGVSIVNQGDILNSSAPTIEWIDTEAQDHPERRYDVYVLDPTDGSNGDLGPSVSAPTQSITWNINRSIYPNGDYTIRLYWSDVDWEGHPETSKFVEAPISLISSTASEQEGNLALGLPYVAWSLQDQRMRDDKARVAWSFKAKRTESLNEMVAFHKVARPGSGSTGYSAGDGGTVIYQFYRGALPDLGELIYQTDDIVGNTRLYGDRPGNTLQPKRSVSNPSFQPFPIDVPVVQGEFYTVVVERQTSEANHMSINSFLIPDETRDFKYTELGLLDPKEWKIHVQAIGASSWTRRDNQIALFALGSDNGTSYGNQYMEELAAPQDDRLYNLSGEKRFRWNIDTPFPFHVEKLGLALVRRSGTEPVIIEIKDESNNALHIEELNFANNPIPGANTRFNDNDWLLQHARIVEAVVDVDLPQGQIFVEVSTGSESNFEIAGLRDGVDSNVFLPRSIDNGFMEISNDDGSSWSKPQQWAQTEVETVQPAIFIFGSPQQ